MVEPTSMCAIKTHIY